MSSPARRHFQRVSGALSTGALASAIAPAGNPYDLMLAKLHSDRVRLKAVQSLERKAVVKAEILPEYFPWVDGVLGADRGGQDDVLATVLVWAIDAGAFGRALDIAAYALRHGLVLPDQYERPIATVLADEIADKALAALRADLPFDAEVLSRTNALTADHDMPDQARAKLLKALGLALRQIGNKADALGALSRALELNTNAGVKRDIAALEADIKNSAA
jgi:tetratricopeptide (TPR) repeat protein